MIYDEDFHMKNLMCQNPAVIHLIETLPNPSYYRLSQNPAIFEYDYTGMKESHAELFKELVEAQFHPKNIDKFEFWDLD